MVTSLCLSLFSLERTCALSGKGCNVNKHERSMEQLFNIIKS